MALTGFAPLSNEQVINPWTATVNYGPVTYQSMNTNDASMEKNIVERVASYGRQLGRISAALRVLIEAQHDHLKLSDGAKSALNDFLSLVAEIDIAKARYTGTDPASLERIERSLAYLKKNDAVAYETLRMRLQRLLALG